MIQWDVVFPIMLGVTKVMCDCVQHVWLPKKRSVR